MDIFVISSHDIGMFGIQISFMYIMIFLCVMMDLRAGIQKAKAAGIYRSSKKLRNTVSKLNKYFNAVFVFTIIDMMINFSIQSLNIDIPLFSYFTFVAAVLVAIIEIKSIYEKTEDKDKADVQEAARVLSYFIKNKDPHEAVESLLKVLSEDKDKQKQDDK